MDRHDPERCPVCAPIIRTEAYQRGRSRALATLNPTVVEIQEVPNQPT